MTAFYSELLNRENTAFLHELSMAYPRLTTTKNTAIILSHTTQRGWMRRLVGFYFGHLCISNQLVRFVTTVNNRPVRDEDSNKHSRKIARPLARSGGLRASKQGESK